MRRRTLSTHLLTVSCALVACWTTASCSTQYLDASPSAASDPDGGDAAGLGQASTTKNAGICLINALYDSPEPLRVYVDGAYWGTDVASGSRIGTMAEGSGGATVPDGFPDGPHELSLERADGEVVLETEQNFVAGAWNLVYVYGSVTSPSFKFSTEPPPSAPNKLWMRMVNLMLTQESLDVLSCTTTACTTVVASGLAYGESWLTEVPTSTAGFAFVSLQGGSLPVAFWTCAPSTGSPTTVRECAILSSSSVIQGPGPY